MTLISLSWNEVLSIALNSPPPVFPCSSPKPEYILSWNACFYQLVATCCNWLADRSLAHRGRGAFAAPEPTGNNTPHRRRLVCSTAMAYLAHLVMEREKESGESAALRLRDPSRRLAIDAHLQAHNKARELAAGHEAQCRNHQHGVHGAFRRHHGADAMAPCSCSFCMDMHVCVHPSGSHVLGRNSRAPVHVGLSSHRDDREYTVSTMGRLPRASGSGHGREPHASLKELLKLNRELAPSVSQGGTACEP